MRIPESSLVQWVMPRYATPTVLRLFKIHFTKLKNARGGGGGVAGKGSKKKTQTPFPRWFTPFWEPRRSSSPH